MTKTYSLGQISKTRKLLTSSFLREYKLDLMYRFNENKPNNSKLTQK